MICEKLDHKSISWALRDLLLRPYNLYAFSSRALHLQTQWYIIRILRSKLYSFPDDEWAFDKLPHVAQNDLFCICSHEVQNQSLIWEERKLMRNKFWLFFYFLNFLTGLTLLPLPMTPLFIFGWHILSSWALLYQDATTKYRVCQNVLKTFQHKLQANDFEGQML